MPDLGLFCIANSPLTVLPVPAPLFPVTSTDTILGRVSLIETNSRMRDSCLGLLAFLVWWLLASCLMRGRRGKGPRL